MGDDNEFAMDSSDEEGAEPVMMDQQEGQFPNPQQKVTKVENDHFDEAVEINDSEELDSEEDAQIDNGAQPTAAAVGEDEPQPAGGSDIPLPATAYNPDEYAGLNVDPEISELFEYITRFTPQTVELESTFRPFIPNYIPAVGEVDAFLKMPKPTGEEEKLGIEGLDEPCLNSSDEKILEMKYVQIKKTDKTSVQKMDVKTVENAERNPSEVNHWITQLEELHKGRALPTVSYTKQMPDPDLLLEEWPPEMERAIESIPFPGPEIAMSTDEYARTMLAFLGIPVHKNAGNKAIVEALHVMFSLYSDFRDNIHFKKQQQNE